MGRFPSFFFLLSVLFACVSCTRHYPEYTPGSPAATGDWEIAGIADGNDGANLGKMRFHVALTLRNRGLLEEKLKEVSYPFFLDAHGKPTKRNPRYGKHLSLSEVNALTAPSSLSFVSVLNWVRSASPGCSIAEEIRGSGFVIVECSQRSSAEALFGARLVTYRHRKAGVSVIRAKDGVYSIPEHLRDVVAFVGGLARFDRLNEAEVEMNSAVVRSKKSPSSSSSSQFDKKIGGGVAVTPRVLRDLYRVAGVTSKTGKSSISVTALIGQYYSASDLAEFLRLFSGSNVGRKVAKIIGPDNGSPGMEANLDVQTVMGMTDKGVPIWFWSIASPAPNNEPFLEWVTQISNTTDAPLVHTTSYGGPESGPSPAYLDRMDAEFMKLGVRGLLLAFASGDSGAGCAPGGATQPDWPASSPHVTAVGGTKFSGLFESGHEEVNGLSGGGFSSVYPRPEYQASAVAKYLSTKSGDLPSAKFNSSGRAYPDIAALSSGFVVVEDKVPTPGVAGTSCASPTAAGVFALVNDFLIANGKPPLGFINPLVYAAAAAGQGAFYDVTEGKQNACFGSHGFPPAEGFDAASGMGAPRYPGIISYIKQNIHTDLQ